MLDFIINQTLHQPGLSVPFVTRPAAAGQGPRRVAASMQCVSVGVCEGVGAGECAGLEGSEGEWSMADDEGLFAAVAGP